MDADVENMFADEENQSEPKTKEEWRAYIALPPPARPTMPSLAEYEAMSELARDEFNEARDDCHSANVIVRTEAMKAIHQEITLKMKMNRRAPAGARRGVVIDGVPGVGKSTLVKLFGAGYELGLRRKEPGKFAKSMEIDGFLCDYTPVLYVSVTSDATPKDLSKLIADWLHTPYKTSATKTDITNRVLRDMKLCGVSLIIVDDLHFLDLSAKEGRIVNDHLKYLANYCSATFVYTGVRLQRSGLFLEGSATERATQTSGRFSLHKVGPFTITTEQQIREWASVIKTMEDALLLYKHKPSTLATRHWQYIHQRTGGILASLHELVRKSATLAVMNGHEAITKTLMDQITLDGNATNNFVATRQRPRPAKQHRPGTQVEAG